MKRLLIITGLSGAGKSTALNALEDHGFTCTDNMPTNLIGSFVKEHPGPFAVAVDSRTPGGNLVEKISRTAAELKNEAKLEIIFFESSDETLVKRYGETRRNHPLARDGNIADGIRREREMLEDVREKAGTVVDTSGLNPHELREILSSRVLNKTRGPRINITSFGFKHGYPPDADMVFDVRMLPNPNFTPRLKPLDGRNGKVRDFVFSDGNASVFLDKASDMIDFVVEKYAGKDKLYLNVAIGCTGGRHRSVAVAEGLGEKLAFPVQNIKVVHRDIRKK